MKKINNLILVFLIGISENIVQASNKQQWVINISIPKSGTYLLMKTIYEMTSKWCCGEGFKDLMALTYTPTLTSIRNDLKQTGFLCLHLVYKPEYKQFCKENNIKVCFIYRDPRDQLVSQAFYMLKLFPNPGRFTFDSLLTALIGNDEKSPKNILYPFQDMDLNVLSSLEYISHIKRFYEGFLGWLNSEVCYATKFEDLVGPKGGGTLEKQKQEILNIAKHTGIDLNSEKTAYIAENIFGGMHTFREGKIGSWREHFTEEHKKQFKEVAGDLLIELGYEQNNNNW